MAKNIGDAARKESVTKRVQIQNPITGTFIKLDTDTGRVVEQKKSPGPFRGVRILRTTKAH